MELVKLFDEERIIDGEEQSRSPAEDEDGPVTWCDVFFKRVRLFKSEASFKMNRSTYGHNQTVPLYLIIEDDCDWVGEDPAYSRQRQRKRVYSSGSDSTRVRQAVAIADGYGGKVNR
ncbi:unnamed protein product [marine sediment metagenome]|uniref:Uncharacterized protein n=1 Tax=marine sediment metagenome TaxID=412755 RepID=X0SER6_9ZZZZ